ncbi:MAG: SIS domain-containing protein [Bacillota bacterium]
MYRDFYKYAGRFFKIISETEVTGGEGPLDLSMGVERTIDLILSRTVLGNKLIFIGNGGSAAIAGHMAIDFWKNGGMRAVAFNDGALLTCIGNDFGYPEVFAKPVEVFAEPGDVLVAISSSGQSENILRGVEAGRAAGCKVITLSGFSRTNPLRKLGDFNFYVPVSHYGFVEVAHQMILHAMLDIIMERRQAGETMFIELTTTVPTLSLDPTLNS